MLTRRELFGKGLAGIGAAALAWLGFKKEPEMMGANEAHALWGDRLTATECKSAYGLTWIDSDTGNHWCPNSKGWLTPEQFHDKYGYRHY